MNDPHNNCYDGIPAMGQTTVQHQYHHMLLNAKKETEINATWMDIIRHRMLQRESNTNIKRGIGSQLH
jgi:hypothetical protein